MLSLVIGSHGLECRVLSQADIGWSAESGHRLTWVGVLSLVIQTARENKEKWRGYLLNFSSHELLVKDVKTGYPTGCIRLPGNKIEKNADR